MNEEKQILGIDIGSITISAIVINEQKKILHSSYLFHKGKIEETLALILNSFDLSRIYGIASTSSSTFSINKGRQYNNQISIISASKLLHKNIGSIILVGGEKFGLFLFDQEGNYRNFKSNTSCAAGTGSFLEQQAARLNLKGVEELSEIAFGNKGRMPKIASRCAVFAKTDLIYAQQEGYKLEEISDGLCYGLAKNIADTLFPGEKPLFPVYMVGGVSKNRAVVKHLNLLAGTEISVDDYSCFYGAIGAAVLFIEEGVPNNLISEISAQEMLKKNTEGRKYHYEPLTLQLSDYPDFKSEERYEFSSMTTGSERIVEVDLYTELQSNTKLSAYLGVDVGSTSTKAVLVDTKGDVLAGFYTRTAGRPLEATQAIFETIDDLIRKHNMEISVTHSAVTGSGRKFIGKIIGANLILDEITAHARAAYSLNPNVDTIIEIGGQDSKFTTMKNGMVTFSIMNNVCAAGTGSFIEEQAKRLGCPLNDYSARAENQRSPMSSDRCTVFMERDINYYLSEGFKVDEVLASVLHSVRDNYLLKVATESSIGNFIFFQGATAKNRALIAAFEQKLEKPIHVSKFCHLTGAIGAALSLIDNGLEIDENVSFRGLSLYSKKVSVSSEICEMCTNHCKLSIAEIDGENVAYGFLCGRDYETKRFVNNNSSGFNLLNERKNAYILKSEKKNNFTIGIPAALQLVENLPFWKTFFEQLSIKTLSSDNYYDALKEGKKVSEAEFCAPMTALYGHVKYLLDKTDYIFIPFYFGNIKRQYCYYTQFAPSVVSALDEHHPERFITPIVNSSYDGTDAKNELLKSINKVAVYKYTLQEISTAYEKAMELKKSAAIKLKEIFKEEMDKNKEFCVMLTGRPYTVLNTTMNKRIPDIFASLGIKTFYQDMLTYEKEDVKEIETFLNQLHWHYAAQILESAVIICKTEGVYPVLVTSFKCTPDSFVIEYFKKIMDSYKKPYLILQLDDSDSGVGYETRIEAAIRAFRNHKNNFHPIEKNEKIKTADSHLLNFKEIVPIKFILPKSSVETPNSLDVVIENKIGNKTLFLPDWDSITCSFLVANLQREGIDARLSEWSDMITRKSLRYNNGQCIPLNIITASYVDSILKNNIKPENALLWNVFSYFSCNIKLYPFHTKMLLQTYGNGMEKAGVYIGDLTFIDISINASLNAYFCYMFGGLIRKIGCRIRPYELESGATDKAIEESVELLKEAFSGKRSKEKALEESMGLFKRIETKYEKRPKVAIFGDFYSRDNEGFNQNLIHYIEKNGGEVITTPYNDYAKIIIGPYLKKWFSEGKYMSVFSHNALLAAITRMEGKYYKYFEELLQEPIPVFNESAEEILNKYNVMLEHSGESMDNLLKIFYLHRHYPDLSLFVQASPAYCCPSIITEAMRHKIEKETGVPIVSITYDGTGGSKNDVIIPYLKYPRN